MYMGYDSMFYEVHKMVYLDLFNDLYSGRVVLGTVSFYKLDKEGVKKLMLFSYLFPIMRFMQLMTRMKISRAIPTGKR